jgi:hypothetical protein
MKSLENDQNAMVPISVWIDINSLGIFVISVETYPDTWIDVYQMI